MLRFLQDDILSMIAFMKQLVDKKIQSFLEHISKIINLLFFIIIPTFISKLGETIYVGKLRRPFF